MIDIIGKASFLEKFGNQLKKLRIEQALSYRKLSKNCEIDHSDIRKIENGERNIQLSTILELAKGLGKHPKELFDFEMYKY
ncbi:helix-turn-helix domain-containing protein [Sphingobacterium spiritivorum]|uniref:helix-turn-helix domain-containing protein n=1 Tax=Sphingobacterium spiritivorum TaxID=258 RepID=UPI003DA6992B